MRRRTRPLILATCIAICIAAPSCRALLGHDEGTAGSPIMVAPEPGAAAAASAPAVVPAQPISLDAELASLRDMYNRAYEKQATYRLAPNAFMLESLARIAKWHSLERRGAAVSPSQQSDLHVLDIAMGDGRNAIALAQHGYHVTGFDISDVGVTVAQKRAHELGLADLFDAQVADAHTFDYGNEQFDVVVMMYYFPWSPAGVDELIDRIKASVKPGGWLIVEYTDRRTTNAALAHFMDWHVVHYSYDLRQRDWAPAHSTVPAFVTQLLARKPKSQ